MIKVTVAIPVYNDDLFIERCLNSILTQTLDQKFIEILCVNDGSTDRSAEILDTYARNHPNVKVEHQKNSGSPSVPRNRAMDKAKGKYIYFVDADDYLGQEALERMVGVGEKYDCDIVVGRYKGENRGVPKAIFRRNPEFFTFFGSNAMSSMNALKMFKVDMLRKENIRFLEGTNIGEDHPFTTLAYICSNGIGIVADYDCYYATRHEDSNRIQLTKQERPFNKIHLFIKETLRRIADLKKDEETIKKGLYHYWDRLLNFEIMYEVNKTHSVEERLQDFLAISSLALKYNPGDCFSYFQPVQKIKFRLLEKGNIKEFIEFSRDEKEQKAYRLENGELYPLNRLAYKIAVEEGVNLSRQNTIVPQVTKAYIVDHRLIIEGHHYHTRLFPGHENLSMKVAKRDGSEVYRAGVKEGLYAVPAALPLLSIPEGKEERGYFSTELDLRFLKNFSDPSYFDFNLISTTEGYSTEARIKVEETYFEQVPFLVNLPYSPSYLEVTPYKTVHGNFSLKVRTFDQQVEGLEIEKSDFRVEARLVRCSFEVKTAYPSLSNHVKLLQLSVDDWIIPAINAVSLLKGEKLIIYAEFPVSRTERRRVLNHAEASLLLDLIEVPIQKVTWIR